jgi:hypothetical protein
LYLLYLQIVGVKVIHNASWRRASIVVLWPFLIIVPFIVIILLIGILLYSYEFSENFYNFIKSIMI